MFNLSRFINVFTTPHCLITRPSSFTIDSRQSRCFTVLRHVLTINLFRRESSLGVGIPRSSLVRFLLFLNLLRTYNPYVRQDLLSSSKAYTIVIPLRTIYKP